MGRVDDVDDVDDVGGESACIAHLVCPECGNVISTSECVNALERHAATHATPLARE